MQRKHYIGAQLGFRKNGAKRS